MSTSTTVRAALGGAAALALALGLTGCSAISSLLGGSGAAAPDRDDEGAVATSATADVFEMAVGDCLNEPTGTEVYEVEFVPCDQPHDYEVFAEQTLPDGDYPTDVDTQAETFCVAEFETFIGVPYEESTISVTWFTPTAESWESGDQLVSCIVTDPAGQSTGSLAGAAR